MARPRKEGLDYFSFDVDFFQDVKIRVLKGDLGNDGVLTYIYLLTQIYKNGYYIDKTDEMISVTALDVGISVDQTRQIVAYLVSRSLLTEISILALPVTVLTSPGIQRRYQLAVRARGQKNAVAVKGEIWLLSPDETASFIKVCPCESFSRNNESFSRKNNSFSMEKSLKKSKVKESKVKYSKNNPAEPVLSPTEDLYRSKIGTVTDKIRDGLAELVAEDGETEVMSAIKIAAEKGARNLGYIRGILRNRRKAEAEQRQKNKFLNYSQRDDVDYDALEKELADMSMGGQDGTW